MTNEEGVVNYLVLVELLYIYLYYIYISLPVIDNTYSWPNARCLIYYVTAKVFITRIISSTLSQCLNRTIQELSHRASRVESLCNLILRVHSAFVISKLCDRSLLFISCRTSPCLVLQKIDNSTSKNLALEINWNALNQLILSISIRPLSYCQTQRTDVTDVLRLIRRARVWLLSTEIARTGLKSYGRLVCVNKEAPFPLNGEWIGWLLPTLRSNRSDVLLKIRMSLKLIEIQ